ncbi:hypothetical protein [Ferrovibrio sp.]|uniref:hypothetical protein n=1 Tax=Ferrovibrio sp. TaxID=1917215 RepID=UPI003D2B3812
MLLALACLGSVIAAEANLDEISMAIPEGASMLAFLDFLARDAAVQPQSVQALTPALKERLDVLVAGVDDDPDQAIEGEVAL